MFRKQCLTTNWRFIRLQKSLSNSPKAAAILLHPSSFICCTFPFWKTWVNAAQAAQLSAATQEAQKGTEMPRKSVAVQIVSLVVNKTLTMCLVRACIALMNSLSPQPKGAAGTAASTMQGSSKTALCRLLTMPRGKQADAKKRDVKGLVVDKMGAWITDKLFFQHCGP